MNSKETGSLGEKIALNYLKNKNYQILDKNYSFRIPSSPQKGEIDIIAKKEDTITFVEVKTLISQSETEGWVVGGWRPEEKVNFQKQRKLTKTAESWLLKRKIPLDSKWQIDIISLNIDFNNKQAKIRHFQNAVF